jgi:hypothetical protein
MGAWLFWNTLYGFNFVDIVISLQVELPRNWDLIPGKVKWFLFFPTAPKSLCGPPSSYTVRTGESFPGPKAARGANLKTPLHVVPTLWMCGATLSLRCAVFVSWCLNELEENFLPPPPPFSISLHSVEQARVIWRRFQISIFSECERC